jgi:hypothetical protein
LTLSHDLDRNHARPDHAAGSIQHVFRELETIEICRGAAPQPPVDMRRFNRASRLSFNLAKKFGCDCCCGIFAATSGRDYLLSPAG